MDLLWPWFTLAGLGALHGLSPANGWMFAAACGVQARDGAQARRALLPIAIGHGASVAIVVAAVSQGIVLDGARVQWLAGMLLVGVAACRALRVATRANAIPGLAAIAAPRRSAGLALWAGLMGIVHGAGLMLVPALIPLCLTRTPARDIAASGSVTVALLAIGVHLAAMLCTTGIVASGVCRGVNLHPRLAGARWRGAWTVILAATGASLIVL